MKNMTYKFHECYFNIAKEVSKLSSAIRLKVGAVLIKDGNILAFGYNGMPAGFDNTCEINGATREEVIHAEINAIAKCAKTSQNSSDSTLYTTTAPCIECAKAIIQAGIKSVYYLDDYRNKNGVELLIKAGLDVKDYSYFITQ